MAARCAWLFGAGRVIVIDEIDYRLEFARSYAPCKAYDFREIGDPVVFLKKATDHLSADVCIDAVGAEAAGSAMQTLLGRKLFLEGGAGTALHWAINSVKKGGIISIVGAPSAMTFRGHQTAATLKRIQERHIRPRVLPFRGHQTAATLKLCQEFSVRAKREITSAFAS